MIPRAENAEKVISRFFFYQAYHMEIEYQRMILQILDSSRVWRTDWLTLPMMTVLIHLSQLLLPHRI